MKVALIGTGRVGLVAGTCLAEVGHVVVCQDLDGLRIAELNEGAASVSEPGLRDLIRANRAAGRLSFTTHGSEAVRHADAIIIAVGSPPAEDGSADVRQVLDAARLIGTHTAGDKVVIVKSTVPVGTAAQVRQVIENALASRGLASSFAVVSNPEFLSEGSAVRDFMQPDRIVIGLEEGESGTRAREVVQALYAPWLQASSNIVYLDSGAAELTKYAANAMLATRISFMNELAHVAGRLGVDIEQVRLGIGSDTRIGPAFLRAGLGYGGSCLPKDCRALVHLAAHAGKRLRLLEAVQEINDAQRVGLVEKVVERFGSDLHGRAFAAWGLAFKPDTNDMSDAPSRMVIRALVERGASVVAHDPLAMPAAAKAFGSDLADHPELLRLIRYVDTPLQALEAADALIIFAEWEIFRETGLAAMKAAMKTPIVFDGRNLYPPAIRSEGFEYHAWGR